MIRCTFRLNGRGLSSFSCPGIGFFPAYSGSEGGHRNNPGSTHIPDVGPLPPGKYYIVSRPTGGTLGFFRDYVDSVISGSDRAVWFALFREDDSIDDTTFFESVQRGNFRLHPAGYQGISHGCITLPGRNHYSILREALLNTPKIMVSANLVAYGTIQVY